MDFKEYTRMRDIVVKRNKRAAAAGLMPLVHFPTVKEIRSGIVDKQQALRALQDYYSSGSQVKAIRQTGYVPEIRQLQQFPRLPEQPRPTAQQKRERKREQQRSYRQRKKIRETAITPEKARKYEGYLKALDTVSKTWKKAGFNIGIDLKSLTPSQAQAFVEYMDYRFAQGDFTQRYVIDEFIQDFSKLLSKGHNPKQITSDFNQFLANREALQNRSNHMLGLSPDEIQSAWYDYIGD